jgi:hypothetical protein
MTHYNKNRAWGRHITSGPKWYSNLRCLCYKRCWGVQCHAVYDNSGKRCSKSIKSKDPYEICSSTRMDIHLLTLFSIDFRIVFLQLSWNFVKDLEIVLTYLDRGHPIVLIIQLDKYLYYMSSEHNNKLTILHKMLQLMNTHCTKIVSFFCCVLTPYNIHICPVLT